MTKLATPRTEAHFGSLQGIVDSEIHAAKHFAATLERENAALREQRDNFQESVAILAAELRTAQSACASMGAALNEIKWVTRRDSAGNYSQYCAGCARGKESIHNGLEHADDCVIVQALSANPGAALLEELELYKDRSKSASACVTEIESELAAAKADVTALVKAGDKMEAALRTNSFDGVTEWKNARAAMKEK